jgi:hypothetical protein
MRVLFSCPCEHYTVIPAQAEIQQEKLSAKQAKSGSCPASQAIFDELDSRLRGNDFIN